MWHTRVYTGAVWTFLVSVCIQVYLAGLGVFVDPKDFAAHVFFAAFVQILGIVVFLLAWRFGYPQRTVVLSAMLPLLVVVQGMLVLVGHAGLQAVAAFHPVNAMVLFALSLYMALRARELTTMRAQSERSGYETTAPSLVHERPASLPRE